MYKLDKLQNNKILYRGSIDGFRCGHFFGWAQNKSFPDISVYIQLFINQEIIAEGVANGYRNDLEEAGIGTGKCSFELRLLKYLLPKKTYTVQLACDGNLVPNVPTYSLLLKNEWEICIYSVNTPWVTGEFISILGPISKRVTYTVCIDQKKIGQAESYIDDNERFLFNYRLPNESLDGLPHLITIYISENESNQLSYLALLHTMSTPWHYNASMPGASEKLFPGLPYTVANRLSSFASSMNSEEAQINTQRIQNICHAFNILNLGINKNKPNTQLIVPACAEPEISIIISVHNKFELTYNCIASIILSTNKSNFEIIVVNDASTDQTIHIHDYIENINVIVNKENIGFLRSCNKAAKVAKGAFLVLLNNDTEVGVAWLDEMKAVFQRFPNVGSVGAKLIYPDGKLQEAGGIIWNDGTPAQLGSGSNPIDPQWNYVRQTDYCSGAALMIPKNIWEMVGGFSEEFAPAYYEDVDLAFKIRNAGYRTFYCPQAEVIHFEGMSHGRDTSVGVKKYQLINEPKFRQKWSDAYCNNGIANTDYWKNKDRGIRFRVLVIDAETPQPDKDAGSYTLFQQIRILQAHGFKVTFIPLCLVNFGKYTIDLQKLGVECLYYPFITSCEELLQKRGNEFDLIYILRYEVAEQLIEYVREYTKAKIVFNNVDLHFLRQIRDSLLKNEKNLAGPLVTRDRELEVIRKVDAILSYTEIEHAVILSHVLRNDNIFKCPWVIKNRGQNTPYEKREGIAFIGGFRHEPNISAVEFFVENVMPIFRRKNKKINFYIYGSNVPEKLHKYECEDVIIKGFVESLDTVFENCRLFVAPLLTGAGIKGKVLDSIAYAIPSVISPIAAEGTGLTNGINTMIAEEPNEWAESILNLYFDEEKWNRMSGLIKILAQEYFSFENGYRLIDKLLKYLGLFTGKAKIVTNI